LYDKKKKKRKEKKKRRRRRERRGRKKKVKHCVSGTAYKTTKCSEIRERYT